MGKNNIQTTTYENGEIHEIFQVNDDGLKDGVYEEYDEAGKKIQAAEYSAGKITKQEMFDDEGITSYFTDFLAKQKTVFSYYPNDTIQKELVYDIESGEKVKQTEFHLNGNKFMEASFKNGKPCSYRFLWNADNTLRSITVFDDKGNSYKISNEVYEYAVNAEKRFKTEHHKDGTEIKIEWSRNAFSIYDINDDGSKVTNGVRQEFTLKESDISKKDFYYTDGELVKITDYYPNGNISLERTADNTKATYYYANGNKKSEIDYLQAIHKDWREDGSFDGVYVKGVKMDIVDFEKMQQKDAAQKFEA